MISSFDEYLRQEEPHRKERAEAWQTAIGLQAVDGLKPSTYLIETARRHIEGDITIDEVKHLIDTYYQSKTLKTDVEKGVKEADNASANITQLLNEKTFSFSPAGYITIHRRIFKGILPFAGKIRDYNITKKEWVLNGDTVLYAGAEEIKATLDYDFEQESRFDYQGLSIVEITEHVAKFISNIWQIHPFAEGNTRTTAVFVIKYLRSMGFNVDNTIFAEHAWYFRNALVRANYRNYAQGITQNNEYLLRLFRNLLMNEKNELKNRYLQVSHNSPTSTPQAKVELNMCEEICLLIKVLGENRLSIKEMLRLLHLSDRKNFMTLYLTPAIQQGFITRLYPEKPNHPRQKYFLTEKGLKFYHP